MSQSALTEFVTFALPDIGEAEIAEVVDTLRSGWITTGPKARQFEEQFAEYLGDDVDCIAVNSATAGLHLALEALGVGPGDEVITTTHTFTATAEVVRYLGATPVFVDVLPDSLCIDPNAVRAALTARSRVLLPVHYGGLAADMTQIISIAREHGLAIVEDAAHSFPTTCGGRLVGTLDSDATVFSFYANKTITTGEGGMLVTRNPQIASRARTMRLHGISRDAFSRFMAKTPSWYYEVVAPGYKYNLTDLAASIGIHQLKRADAIRARRAEIAQHYDDAFRHLPLLLPGHAAPMDLHAWHLYVIRLTDKVGLARDQFIEEMFARGVGCSVHYIPLHLQPYWRDEYGLRPEMFPTSQRAYERMVSLPIYSRMTDEDVERVITATTEILA
jgi:dTDP-4-amino-4,6-dideoxygalactose transaminase